MGIVSFRAHHMGLSVPNLDAAVKWYQDILGFSVEKLMEIPPIGAKIAWLKKDDFRIELFEKEGAAPLPEDRKFPNRDLMTHGWKHLSIEVEDPKTALAAFKAAGVEIAMENVVDGRAMGFIRDNSGNLIEINQIGTPLFE